MRDGHKWVETDVDQPTERGNKGSKGGSPRLARSGGSVACPHRPWSRRGRGGSNIEIERQTVSFMTLMTIITHHHGTVLTVAVATGVTVMIMMILVKLRVVSTVP